MLHSANVPLRARIAISSSFVVVVAKLCFSRIVLATRRENALITNKKTENGTKLQEKTLRKLVLCIFSSATIQPWQELNRKFIRAKKLFRILLYFYENYAG